MQAAILAGGEGRRMRRVTERPKALLDLGGKPLLGHQLDWLKNSGFAEIFLCLGYRADDIQERFGDGSRWGMRLRYQVEDAPRGTAGAVKDLAPMVHGNLLVLYGDLFVEFDYAPLRETHDGHDGAATVVVRRSEHPEDSDIVEADAEGRIRAVGRLGSGKVSGDLACAAVSVVRPRLLEHIPADRPSDFARDVFPAALAAGERLVAHRIESGITDIGTPERYEAVQRRLSQA